MEKWMTNASESTRLKKISNLSLVGTHDSAAYKFNGIYMPNKIGGIRINFLEFLRRNCCIAGNIIRDWTLTQELSIIEQLNAGVRVFDLRLSFANDQLLLSHTFSCITFEKFLKQLTQFTNKHPGEVIIMFVKPDFIHRETLTDAVWQTFFNATKSYCGNKLYSRSDVIPTLFECQKSGKRIFCNVQFNNVPNNVPGFVWTSLQHDISKQGYLFESPSDDIVIQDIKNRLLRPCCYEKKTLKNFSKSAEEIFSHLSQQNLNIWWLDFPQTHMIKQLIDRN